MGRYREVHTEKEAKRFARRYAASIWWVLWAVCFVILAYTARMQFSDYQSTKGANSVVAKYSSEKGVERATFMDEDNHYHSYDITGMGAEHDGDSIVLYYTDDINLAQPRIGASTWIRSYAIFGVALVLLSIRLIFIYRSDHSVYADGNLSIDEIQVPDDTSVGIMSRR
jgi:hypothetical protein